MTAVPRKEKNIFVRSYKYAKRAKNLIKKKFVNKNSIRCTLFYATIEILEHLRLLANGDSEPSLHALKVLVFMLVIVGIIKVIIK